MIGWLRRLAECFSRNVVLRRKLPERFGGRPMLVTPDSRLGYWRKSLERVEPGLFRWADTFVSEGMCVWDVGANVGVFSVAAAVRAGPDGDVVAVEPDLEMARLLRRSAELEGERPSAPVTVLPLAAGENNELVELQVAERGRSSNFIGMYRGGTQAGGVRESHQVLSVSLDWIGRHVRPPDVLKVDVEGGELAVLRGARGMLDDYRPVVLAEVYERNREEVGDLLDEIGYRFFDATRKLEEDPKPLPKPTSETLCLPDNVSPDRMTS